MDLKKQKWTKKAFIIGENEISVSRQDRTNHCWTEYYRKTTVFGVVNFGLKSSLAALKGLCAWHAQYFFPLQEISTAKDEVIEFPDDRNQLVWFLQPHEAQFSLAVETLKFKPKPFGKARTPFTPKHGHSPQLTPANSNPSLYVYNVKADSESNTSAGSSDESDDHSHKPLEAWSPDGFIQTDPDARKKKSTFRKIKHLIVGKREK